MCSKVEKNKRKKISVLEKRKTLKGRSIWGIMFIAKKRNVSEKRENILYVVAHF